MPIYLDNEGTIAVGPLTDAAGELVVGATVTASLLRAGTEIWSDTGTTSAAGEVTIDVPHPLLDDAEEEIPLVEGEILTERVEVESGTLNASYDTERRVRRRLG